MRNFNQGMSEPYIIYSEYLRDQVWTKVHLQAFIWPILSSLGVKWVLPCYRAWFQNLNLHSLQQAYVQAYFFTGRWHLKGQKSPLVALVVRNKVIRKRSYPIMLITISSLFQFLSLDWWNQSLESTNQNLALSSSTKPKNWETPSTTCVRIEDKKTIVGI